MIFPSYSVLFQCCGSFFSQHLKHLVHVVAAVILVHLRLWHVKAFGSFPKCLPTQQTPEGELKSWALFAVSKKYFNAAATWFVIPQLLSWLALLHTCQFLSAVVLQAQLKQFPIILTWKPARLSVTKLIILLCFYLCSLLRRCAVVCSA